MDLDGDGHIDILSGSYSRSGAEMAGLFQMLRGTPGGGFRQAEALNGFDDEPLIIPKGEGDGAIVDAICTRPTAADLNGDGHRDLVFVNAAEVSSPIPAYIYASSEESVGEFWFGESAEIVIQSGFVGFLSAETIGFSGDQF